MASLAAKASLANRMSKVTFPATNKRLPTFEEEVKAWRKEMDEWRKEKAAILKGRDTKRQDRRLQSESCFFERPVTMPKRENCQGGGGAHKVIEETIEMKTKAMADPMEGKIDAKEEGRWRYVHSYQSYLWNQAASKRITLYGVDKVVEGDLVFCMDSTNSEITLEGEASQKDCKKGSESEEVEYDGEEEIVLDVSPAYVKHVTADDVDFQKFSIHDVVLPLPGSKTSLPKNDVANTYEELARKDSLDLHQSAHNVKDFSFVHLSGSYRRLIQKAQGLDWKILKYDNNTQALAETDWDRIKIEKGKNANGEEEAATRAATPAFSTAANEGEKDPCIKQTALQLKFVLPSSCYATMALRELMKISSSDHPYSVLQVPPIYLDDDLTRMQVEHRRACMPRVLQARKEGKRAIYRDNRVIIDGKAID
ncbi:hypothetical protein L7F22_003497 [Adiantum nelumboides]|nr:hypothetical protein [Adiantum nelumboides]